jgi:hypothetical protein
LERRKAEQFRLRAALGLMLGRMESRVCQAFEWGLLTRKTWLANKTAAALVYRLAYNDDVVADQLAVFQGASEAPISDAYGSSEQRRKTANWLRPGGLR